MNDKNENINTILWMFVLSLGAYFLFSQWQGNNKSSAELQRCIENFNSYRSGINERSR